MVTPLALTVCHGGSAGAVTEGAPELLPKEKDSEGSEGGNEQGQQGKVSEGEERASESPCETESQHGMMKRQSLCSAVPISSPSFGCFIQDMPNGYSKVTWVEHVEIEDKTLVHRLFRNLVYNGMAFGAQRWLAVLQRMCERLACLTVTENSTRDLGGEGSGVLLLGVGLECPLIKERLSLFTPAAVVAECADIAGTPPYGYCQHFVQQLDHDQCHFHLVFGIVILFHYAVTEVPDNVFLLEGCPHDWLFPQCSAM
ncbi:hypothetical protein S83_066927, partial [Arachis hypogaea]